MSLRILIVDDTPVWAELIQKQLHTGWLKDTQLEVEFFIANSHRSAIALIDQHLFDFAVVDLSIPYRIDKNYPYSEILWGGIAVLEAIKRRYPIIVVTGYSTPDRVQEIASQYGVHYSFSKDDNFLKQLNKFYRECSAALLKWRIENAASGLKNRPVLTIYLSDNDQFRLEYAINGNILSDAPQVLHLTNRANTIRRGHNVWQMIINNQPNIWRPEVQSIGEEVYQQLATHPQFNTYTTLIKNNASSLPPLIRLNASTQFLPFPFEWLYYQQPFSLAYALTRRLPIDRHDRIESFHQWVKTKKDHQAPINVLLIGANSDGNIPQTETEVDELQTLYNDMHRLYNLNIHVTCLKGEDASLAHVRHILQNRRFDILHYAGHSHFDEQSGEFSHLILRDGDKLGAMTASDLKNYLNEHPLQVIFFSSCWSGHAHVNAHHYGDFTGIIPAVLQTQIPIVVGYRWAVNDTLARLFAQHFHQQLWHHFIPSQAMHESRRYIIQEGNRRNNNIWLSALLITQNDD